MASSRPSRQPSEPPIGARLPAVIPRVAAIMVGINDKRWLGPALASLTQSADQGSGYLLDIYYVDNNSADGSAAYVRESFPRVRVIENEANLGFARANNQVMRDALDDRADYVFLVNPDTFTPSELVGHLTAFMEEWRDYGIVGPLQWNYSGRDGRAEDPNSWTKSALAAGESHGLAVNRASLLPPPDPGTPRAPHTLEHAYVQGAALFARAEMLRAIGIFDEAYHTFYEETDLCRRARLAGWRVALLTKYGIYHQGGEGSPYRRLLMMRNKYYFLLTDIDMKAADMVAIAWGWLLRDLAGDGVGGRSTPGRAWLELARSTAWLLARIPGIIRRRRIDANLRVASGDRSV